MTKKQDGSKFCHLKVHMGVKGKNSNRKKPFSRLNILLTCVIIALVYVIINAIVRNEWGEVDGIIQDGLTVLISVVCSVLASTIMPRVLQSSNKEDVREVFQDEIEKIVTKDRLASPVKVFMDTEDPNPEFNDMLNKSILTTENYIYFSDRAMYTAKRLRREIDSKAVNPHLKIEVFVADFRDNMLFEARRDEYLARERKTAMKVGKKRGLQEIIRQEKRDIIKSLYALGKLREYYEITVYLHKELPFIRFEITDTLFVMTFLNRINMGKKHPATVIYSNETIFKPGFEDYIENIKRRAYKMNDDDITVDGLKRMAKRVGINCSNTDITEYYDNL